MVNEINNSCSCGCESEATLLNKNRYWQMETQKAACEHAGTVEALAYQPAEEQAEPGRQVLTLNLLGLDCADCAAKLEKKLAGLAGVEHVQVNFGASKLYLEGSLPAEKVIRAVQEAGYDAEIPGQIGQQKQSFLAKNKKALTTAISGGLIFCGLAASTFKWDSLVIPFYLWAIIVGGYQTARSGVYSLKSGWAFDMNFLMTIAVVGAAAIGEWEEAATVVFLFSLGNALEAYTMERTRNSIRGLMELAPKEALVRKDGQEIVLPVEQLSVNDLVIIKPGERIPIDGRVACGNSSVNQASITGESIPVVKTVGDEVFAGTINEKGMLEVSVTRLVGDTTLAKIIEMVEEAQAQKAPSQRFVDVFARYYTPAVIGLALLIAVVPPVFFGGIFSKWFYRALALLVVSCPCALVISTPVSIVAAIGNAARNGVLIKGGAYLEQAGAVKVIAFDKTGTLTRGKPEVTDIILVEAKSEAEVLKIAGAVEERSEHPLAEAVMTKVRQSGINYPTGKDFSSLTGKGAQAVVNGRTCLVASPRFFADEQGLKTAALEETIMHLEEEGKTVILVGTAQQIFGIIAIADSIRESSSEALKELKSQGVKTIMLTGDNRRTARAIARKLGLDEFKAELLPEHKLEAVQAYQKQLGPVAMIGDGINDAPALAAATVGIAMGGAGTDTALETADIALMADDLGKLPFTIRLSQKALRIIKQNIGFSLVVKLLAIVLVFPGILNLWIAIAADTGASLVVIANGMRLLRAK